MNSCVRCQGLLVEFFDEALGYPNIRCVMCAHRPLDPLPHPPVPHGLCRPKYGDLVTCRCGKPKVEWRASCVVCLDKKLRAERARKAAVKRGIKSKKITKGRIA